MAGKAAFGASLSRDNGTDFDAIANITNVSGPGISRETLDVTAHDSADSYMEFVGSLIDGGEVSCDLNWDPADESLDSANTTEKLLEDFESEDPVDYEIAFPDGAKFEAPLLITGFEPEAPYDDKLAASLSFQVAGKPTFTPAA